MDVGSVDGLGADFEAATTWASTVFWTAGASGWADGWRVGVGADFVAVAVGAAGLAGGAAVGGGVAAAVAARAAALVSSDRSTASAAGISQVRMGGSRRAEAVLLQGTLAGWCVRSNVRLRHTVTYSTSADSAN